MQSEAKALRKSSLVRSFLAVLLLIPCAPDMSAQQISDPAIAETASSALVVKYEAGLLSIEANNISLSAILQEVRAKTGVIIENSASDESQGLVVANLGPGNPSAIISELLYGTPWNYAVLGAPGDSNKIERILLMPKRAAPAQVATVTPPSTTISTQQAAASIAETEDSSTEPEATDDAVAENANDEDADKQAKDESDTDEAKTAKKSGAQDKTAGEEETEESAAANPEQTPMPVFPEGLYRMYPGLFGDRGSQISGGDSSAAITPTGGSGNTPSLYSAMGGRGGTGVQADIAAEAPVTPREFPPELWKMYPPNLLDLIKNAAPPPPPPAPAYVPPGTGVLWDQGITAR